MMDRPTFISGVAFGFCAAPPAANAQPAGKMYRIGILSSAPMRTDADFRQGAWVLALRALGWIEGQNIVFERRASDGKADLLPGLARSLRVELQFFPYRSQAGVDAAFPAMVGMRVQAFLLEPTFQIFANRGRIAELALKHRLPGVFTLREYAAAGGLMSYGPDYPSLERQHARYIDRILRGANPGDLPIEQPTKFELVINLKTAKTLGITAPRSMLLRAHEVIQ
jgi:ABC-type uncharacterized transport system substrate-binding protein